jgi:hypothetical protein
MALGKGEVMHASPGGDVRCLCGRLLARLVEGGVEIKCARCKRACIVPLEDHGDAPVDRELRRAAKKPAKKR